MTRFTPSPRPLLPRLLLLSLAGACGASRTSMPDSGLPDLPPTMGPACNGAASSDLTGVSIVFPDDRCSFTAAEAAAGITIEYTVVVANTLTGVSPAPLDAGHCNQPDPEFGLSPFPKLSGGDQQYCLCDVGPCNYDPSHPPSTVVPAGRYERSMAWMGKNWRGPSDTGNPVGAAFPPGSYTFNVTAKGTWIAAPGATTSVPFTVSADRTITITP